MLAKRTNGIPAYKRIQADIRTYIEAGELRAGNLVPSERELARIHDVSLMTARHALASLEREGVVERRRGVGTFVAAPKIHFNKLMSYTEQMGSRGLAPVSKILFVKVIDDEEEATARLSLSPRSRVLKLERLRHAGGEPFALETCYLPAEQFSNPPLCRKNLCSPRCSASIASSSAIPTKKWTPLLRTREPPNFWASQDVHPFCASGRSSILRRGL